MRERLTLSPEAENLPHEAKEALTFECKKVTSKLDGPNGEHADLSVAVAEKDGNLRHVNFWDLDKTLLVAEPIHAKAVEQIFPENAKTDELRSELHKVYFDGFKLGNSFREWDRMWRIY
ncbi:MAG: hypothetical protein AAB511_00775, partial [Patescibacteria group bacterium]